MMLYNATGKVVMIQEGIREEEMMIFRGDLKSGYYLLKLVGKRIYQGTLIIR